MFNLKINRRTNFASSVSPLAKRLRRLSFFERMEEAKAFLDTLHRENFLTDAERKSRWSEIRASLNRRGFYEHTSDEIAIGARIAWRNHSRCIGRMYWESLEVFDCRKLTEPDAIADRIVQHMVDALGDGRIRSIISVFAPILPGTTPAYIESQQVTQYAGYVQKDGTVLGDRRNVESTRIAMSLGFRPPEQKSAFDMLPVMVRDSADRRILFEIPPYAYREIEIRHPTCPQIAELGLKWYAVPCVSGMILTIGGIDYPCAPFNGFYMGTEIASRNLVDKMRYDSLPAVSRAIGDDPDRDKTLLWQDRALTELNRAVLYSYKSAGVTIIDHHTASDNFTNFCQREQVSGRHVSADWSWIVPPQASSRCEVFHLKMEDFAPVPNYYHSRADDALRMMPYYGDQQRNRLQRRWDKLMRRWKLWSRSAS